MILTLESSAYSYTLDEGKSPAVIGRERECQVFIPEAAVSHRQAELTCEQGHWFVRDLGSKYGTAVNGKLVKEKTPLENGDILRLSTLSFVVTLVESISHEHVGARLAGGELKELIKTAAAKPPASVPAKTEAHSSAEGAAKEQAEAEAKEEPKERRGGKTDTKQLPAVSAAAASAPSTERKEKGERKTARGGLGKAVVWVCTLIVVGCLGYIGWAAWQEYQAARAAREAVPPPAPALPEGKPAGAASVPLPDRGMVTEVASGTAPQSAAPAPGASTAFSGGQPQPAAPLAGNAGPAGLEGPARKAGASAPVLMEDEPPKEPAGLPPQPAPIPVPVSRYEPRWFAGPGLGTLWLKEGAPLKGQITLEKDKVLINTGTLNTTVKAEGVEQVTWEGSRNFLEADNLLALGLYGAAAVSYAEALRKARASLLEAGTPEEKLEISGRWYAEGRMQECQLKAEHLDWCRTVMTNADAASKAQLLAAVKNYLMLAVPGTSSRDLDAALDALVTAGKVALDGPEREALEALKKHTLAATADPKALANEIQQAQEQAAAASAGKAAAKATAVGGGTGSNTRAPAEAPASAARTAADGNAGGGAAWGPKMVTLTYAGGAGDQWIQEVGFNADGTVFGKGSSFGVSYSADGAKLQGITGDLNAPCGGPKGPDFANKGGKKFTDPGSGATFNIITKQVHAILQQPLLTSSAGWKWWGWSHAEAQALSLMADSRGIGVMFLPRGRFLAKCWTDGGNTTLERDPRDLGKRNPALANAVYKGAGGSASLYLIGDTRTGEPLYATWMAHRPQAECCDEAGRIYMTQHAAKRFGPSHKDAFGLGGGAGLAVFNPTLSRVEFSTTLGGDRALCVAVRGRMCVVGGVIGGDAAKLPVQNPAQPKPGGGEDGFLAILRLW